MEIRLSLESSSARILAGLAGIAICWFLAGIVLDGFIGGVLADERVSPQTGTLESYLRLQPESARIQAKLAEALLADPDRDMRALDEGARTACNLSPHDYRYRLLLATVEEAEGNRPAAEAALETARRLAPNNAEILWRSANLLLRDGRLGEAQDAFRAACHSDVSLLTLTLDLMWRADLNTSALESVAPSDPESQLSLAGFLLSHDRPSEAAAIFSGIPRSSALKLPRTITFVNALVGAREAETARRLWAVLIGADPDQVPLLWNGGFENALQKMLNQFDWQFGRSPYANISIDQSTAHSGSRSLKVEFLGRDTTKLDREITQQVVLESGSRYRLRCFVRTSQLESPEGPRLAVADQTTGETVAISPAIASGSDDWKPLMVEFTAPQDKSGHGHVLASVSIVRKPRFSYDEPTRGTIWFDDFELSLEPR